MEIPLFPLNMVLFPGMPINLHIFEERYKLMVNECIDNRQPFGVVLIANGQDDTSHSAEPHLIGCTAQITQVQPLQEGRMNITAIGRERFQIVSFNYEKPYLSGAAETYPLIRPEDVNLERPVRELRYHLAQYLKTLQRARKVQFETMHLPNEPTALAYLSAVLLQVEPADKQPLLAARRLDEMIDMLLRTYRREVVLLDSMLHPPDHIDENSPFTLN
ncbi:MAG: LON peptidase substrate-binding domain-containing protein [Chloroflexota bacterium]